MPCMANMPCEVRDTVRAGYVPGLPVSFPRKSAASGVAVDIALALGSVGEDMAPQGTWRISGDVTAMRSLEVNRRVMEPLAIGMFSRG